MPETCTTLSVIVSSSAELYVTSIFVGRTYQLFSEVWEGCLNLSNLKKCSQKHDQLRLCSADGMLVSTRHVNTIYPSVSCPECYRKFWSEMCTRYTWIVTSGLGGLCWALGVVVEDVHYVGYVGWVLCPVSMCLLVIKLPRSEAESLNCSWYCFISDWATFGFLGLTLEFSVPDIFPDITYGAKFKPIQK